MLAALDLVAHPLQLHRKLRTIDRRRVLLRFIEFLRLQRPRVAIGGFGHIEDDHMRMKLRRGIPVNRSAAVMLELGDGPRARRLRRDVAADPRLHILFHLIERDLHALPVRLSDAVVAANQRRQRHRLRCAERRIPSGPVLHRVDDHAALVLILPRRLMPHQLLPRLWMLALTEPRELLLVHLAMQPPPLRKLPLPLAPHTRGLRVVVLFGVGELFLVVRLGLPRRDRFGDRHHKRFTRSGAGASSPRRASPPLTSLPLQTALSGPRPEPARAALPGPLPPSSVRRTTGAFATAPRRRTSANGRSARPRATAPPAAPAPSATAIAPSPAGRRGTPICPSTDAAGGRCTGPAATPDARTRPAFLPRSAGTPAHPPRP